MEEQNPQNQQAQITTQSQNSDTDLSSLFKDGEPGTYDSDKIVKLMRDFENSKKSASYFQSQYMKKEGIPESIDGYFKDFRADSSYANGMEKDDVKNAKESLAKFAFENNISPRNAELFFDYTMKNLAKAGYFTEKTEEQIAEEQRKADEEAMKEVAPMLESLNRSKEDNDKYIEKFLNSESNPFTNDPKMKEYLENIADDGAMGYKIITMMEQVFNHSGVPVISGTVEGKDKAAFEAALAKETNPEIREKMMKEYYGE